MNLWMKAPGDSGAAKIVVFRTSFELKRKRRIKFRYSADERCQWFLDGEPVGSGPERGTPEYWYRQNCAFSAAPGRHVLTARVLCFGRERTAYGQASLRHGLFVEDRESLFGSWHCQREAGCAYSPPFPDWGGYPRVAVSSDYNCRILSGKGGRWREVELFEDNRVLHRPDLPEMKYDEVFPSEKRGDFYRFRNYVCVWCRYRFRGTGRVSIRWAECGYETPDYDRANLKGGKGNREGKYFVGNFDEFEIDGELLWCDYYWRCGHYVEVRTSGGVTVEPRFFATGYPLPAPPDPSPSVRAAVSSLQACCHDTLMDCPFYEQLMYVADARLEALALYHISDDHRPAAKALKILALSQQPDGSLLSRYPSRSKQVIPSFMMIYLLMMHDYFRIHGRDELIRRLLPCARRLAAYLQDRFSDLRQPLPGWNFVDWCNAPGWNNGVPPGNGITGWFLVLAFQALADMVSPDYAVAAENLKKQLYECFYDEKRGLFADDERHGFFSEHAQVLALLADPSAPVREGLSEYKNLAECGIYFSYYYLDACRKFRLDNLFRARLSQFDTLLEKGLTTIPEEFGNSRSDCHGWGAYIVLFQEPIAKSDFARSPVSVSGCLPIRGGSAAATGGISP